MAHALRATHHCRHYSYERDRRGILFGGEGGGPTCARGVDLKTEPGAAFKCMPADGRELPPCVLRQDFTEVERAAWAAERDAMTRRMLLIGAAIPSEGCDGELPCPACGSGIVHWSRAPYNGHLAAACSTPHCFSVIQ